MKPNTTQFEPSVDAVTIAKRLSTLAKGESITYTEINALVPPLNISGRHRYILETARQIAQRDSDVVTGCITGVGLKRLTDSEIAGLPTHTIGRVRRMAKRTIGKSVKGDMANMTEPERKKHLFGQSVLGAVGQFISPKRLRTIENKVAAEPRRISFNETIRLFA